MNMLHPLNKAALTFAALAMALNASAYYEEGRICEEDGWQYMYVRAVGEDSGDLVTLCAIPQEVIEEAQASHTLILPDNGFFLGEEHRINFIGNVLNDLTGIEEVVLPSHLVQIAFCFNNCRDLKRVVFGNEIKNILDSFSQLPNLESIDLPSSVVDIEHSFIESNIGGLDLGNVTILDNEAICNLPNIIRLELSADTKSVGQYSLCNLPNLKEIVLPDGSDAECVLSERILLDCPSLEQIFAPSAIPLKTLREEVEFGTDPSNRYQTGIDKQRCVLYVPVGAVEAYRNAPAWKAFTNIKEYDFSGVGATFGEQKNLVPLSKRISIYDGRISLTDCNGEPVTICTADGKLIYTGNPKEGLSMTLHTGIYILKSGHTTMKLAVN